MTALLKMNLVGSFVPVMSATCVKCGEYKPLVEFHKNSAQAHPFDVRKDCKVCTSSRAKEYRSTHKEEIKATAKRNLLARAEVALARGGSNWPANMRPACERCNYSKGAKKLFSEWMPPNARSLN